jgi:heme-degrading monooxygenase HmoA
MITEVADFLILEDKSSTFEGELARAAKDILAKAKGYVGHKILSSHETPNRFLLVVEWETIEDHVMGFRQSEAFIEWRGIIGPFFKNPPTVEHFNVRKE